MNLSKLLNKEFALDLSLFLVYVGYYYERIYGGGTWEKNVTAIQITCISETMSTEEALQVPVVTLWTVILIVLSTLKVTKYLTIFRNASVFMSLFQQVFLDIRPLALFLFMVVSLFSYIFILLRLNVDWDLGYAIGWAKAYQITTFLTALGDFTLPVSKYWPDLKQVLDTR